MLDIYKSLEDSLYAYVSTLFPEWRIIHAFQNGPEPKTPYLIIDVKRLDAIGMGQTSGSVTIDPTDPDAGKTTTTQDYNVKVRFEFVGKYENNNELAEMVHILDATLRTPHGLEQLARNKLALYRVSAAERIRLMRETDVFMYYQLDVVFGYCVQMITDQDWIEAITLTENFDDSGSGSLNTSDPATINISRR